MQFFNQSSFIKFHITKRTQSLFQDDIENNRSELKEKINGKSILVIGGAGTIGSSFIKAIIPFLPKKFLYSKP